MPGHLLYSSCAFGRDLAVRKTKNITALYRRGSISAGIYIGSTQLYIGLALYQLGSVSARIYIGSDLYQRGSICVLCLLHPPAICSLLWYIGMILVMGLPSLICFSLHFLSNFDLVCM